MNPSISAHVHQAVPVHATIAVSKTNKCTPHKKSKHTILQKAHDGVGTREECVPVSVAVAGRLSMTSGVGFRRFSHSLSMLKSVATSLWKSCMQDLEAARKKKAEDGHLMTNAPYVTMSESDALCPCIHPWCANIINCVHVAQGDHYMQDSWATFVKSVAAL